LSIPALSPVLVPHVNNCPQGSHYRWETLNRQTKRMLSTALLPSKTSSRVLSLSGRGTQSPVQKCAFRVQRRCASGEIGFSIARSCVMIRGSEKRPLIRYQRSCANRRVLWFQKSELVRLLRAYADRPLRLANQVPRNDHFTKVHVSVIPLMNLLGCWCV
jgi:hypothetical protein